MNPNSANQLWSLWTTIIGVPFHQTHAGDEFQNEMRSATARVFRKLFGSATELRITRVFMPGLTQFKVECRTEGFPAPDGVFRKRRMDAIAEFFGKNLQRYGRVDVRVDVRVEAGDAGDGKPPAQLILGPPVALLPRARMLGR
jgi:hypothetical protein